VLKPPDHKARFYINTFSLQNKKPQPLAGVLLVFVILNKQLKQDHSHSIICEKKNSFYNSDLYPPHINVMTNTMIT
ncbi:hypothetical protein WAE56_20595, partial [Iodobacter sp. LRB]|uniref:hypothetical protein n=1 Tax=Iodobacter sp. LRB TaxID=3127955 RepID=UPI00307D61C2